VDVVYYRAVYLISKLQQKRYNNPAPPHPHEQGYGKENYD